MDLAKQEKHVWTEGDFDLMGWHDCQIHAIAFFRESAELAFDIDYIVEWLAPQPDNSQFQFWIAPATLLFWNVRDVDFDIESWNPELELCSITKTEIGRPINGDYIKRDMEWEWSLELQEGTIKLKSVGYTQYLRRVPRLSASLRLDCSDRGEPCFARGMIQS